MKKGGKIVDFVAIGGHNRLHAGMASKKGATSLAGMSNMNPQRCRALTGAQTSQHRPIPRTHQDAGEGIVGSLVRTSYGFQGTRNHKYIAHVAHADCGAGALVVASGSGSGGVCVRLRLEKPTAIRCRRKCRMTGAD